MNNVDKIFKSKLDNLQVRPPQIAWNTIEDQLEVRNQKRFPFLKIAASLVIISLSTLAVYYLYAPGNPSNSSNAIIQNENSVATNDQQADPVLPNDNETDKQIATQPIAAKENIVKRTHFSNLQKLKPLYNNISVSEFPGKEIQTIKTEAIAMEIPEQLDEPLPPVTISFKSGDKNFGSNATSASEKESTLKKAWEYALSVKNGEERPFNIKEMKNELFAFDFSRKKKSKTQD